MADDLPTNSVKCSRCASANLRSNVLLNKQGVSYLSGFIVKNKPLHCTVCLDCGKVDLEITQPEEIKDKEIVQGNNSLFLSFILFALFILSLQLE